MSEEKKQRLLSLLITEMDRSELLSFLNALSDSLYKVDGAAKIILENNARFGKSLIAMLPEKWDTEDKDNASKILGALTKEIISIESVEVDIATDPTDRIINLISAWSTRAFKNKMIVSIKVKPEIIGGVIVVVDGVYKDLSLANKLSRAFDEKKGEISTLINVQPKAE